MLIFCPTEGEIHLHIPSSNDSKHIFYELESIFHPHKSGCNQFSYINM